MPTQKDPTALYCQDPSLAQQNTSDETDVDKILDRATRTGQLTVNSKPGRYADVSEIPDFSEAQRIVARGDALFMSLDWKIREKFHNNPAELHQFLMDSKNKDEAIGLGLIEKPTTQKPDEHLETLKSIDTSLKASSHPTSKKRSDKEEG